jgi:hypothetical protein
MFYRYLASVNYAIAKWINENGLNVPIDSFLEYSRVENIYIKLYKEVTLNEATIQWNEFGDGLKKKDLIDDLIGILTPGESQPISLWRRLINQFITVRIAGRITEVNTTTRKRIARLIEKGIEEGLGASQVATSIRKDQKYNRNRALAIARTETITAANQGKYIAALSSPYVKLKKWLPVEDSRARLSHLDMEDRPFIGLKDPFYLANADGVLEEAQYPGDNTLSASNVINCRCAIVFKNQVDDNGRPIRKSKSNEILTKEIEKEYSTQIQAIDPTDGVLKLWSGDRVKAKSFDDAVEWCKEHKGYLEVKGEFKGEIEYKHK